MIARLAELVLPHLPKALEAPLAWVAGTIAYLIADGPRRAVRSNLSIVAPRRRDRERLVREVFVWQARHYLELFRLAGMTREETERTIRIVGFEHVERARARGKGVVFASAHIGPVSVCGQVFVARGIDITLPVERETSEMSRVVNRARLREGITFVPTDSALGIYRVLRSGGALGILSDRAVTGVGVRVPFFGREALLPSAAVVLALRTGAAFVPGFAGRDEGGLTTTFFPELELPRTGDHDADVREGVRRYAQVMEDVIRRHPEEWSVFEPVWDVESVESAA